MTTFKQGQTIQGGYQLLEPIGRGTYGEVWRALDVALNGEVAIKFIHRLPQTDEASKAVLEEGHKLRALADSRHPGARNVVYVHRAVTSSDETPPFLDLEWMPGGSLSSRIRPGVPFSQDRLLDIATQIGQALSCAHAQNLVHCDLKPGNVLLSEDEQVIKLSDFGLARRFSELTQGSWGTPAYMSPEQFRNVDELGPKTDIYSLGVLLFQCAEGRLPFEGRNRHDYDIKHCQTPAPAIENALLAREVSKLIADCLSKQPSGRPDANELLRRIRQIGRVVDREADYAPDFESLRQTLNGIIHAKSEVEFGPGSARGHFAPQRMITNQDFYRFLGDSRFRKWRPGSVGLSQHDGGYLHHWFLGKPLQRDYNLPIQSLHYDVALDFARWFVGSLPSFDELESIFYGSDFPELAVQYRTFLEDSGLPFLQFWCRDEVEDAGMAAVWRLLPDRSPLALQLARSKRPRTYAFPYHVFLAVIPSSIVGTVRDGLTPDFGDSLPSGGATSESWKSDWSASASG